MLHTLRTHQVLEVKGQGQEVKVKPTKRGGGWWLKELIEHINIYVTETYNTLILKCQGQMSTVKVKPKKKRGDV